MYDDIMQTTENDIIQGRWSSVELIYDRHNDRSIMRFYTTKKSVNTTVILKNECVKNSYTATSAFNMLKNNGATLRVDRVPISRLEKLNALTASMSVGGIPFVQVEDISMIGAIEQLLERKSNGHTRVC